MVHRANDRIWHPVHVGVHLLSTIKWVAMISLPTLFAVGVVGACTPATPTGGAQGEGRPSHSAAPSDASGRPLTEAVQSPESPPAVRAMSVEANPINSDWRFASGERQVVSPDSGFSAQDLAAVVAPAGEAPLRVEIASPVPPTQIDVVVFDELDASGVPVGAGREVHCLQSDDCSLEHSLDKISLSVPVDQNSDVVILHLYYAVVPTGSEEGVDVETNYASYGWRLS